MAGPGDSDQSIELRYLRDAVAIVLSSAAPWFGRSKDHGVPVVMCG